MAVADSGAAAVGASEVEVVGGSGVGGEASSQRIIHALRRLTVNQRNRRSTHVLHVFVGLTSSMKELSCLTKIRRSSHVGTIFGRLCILFQ